MAFNKTGIALATAAGACLTLAALTTPTRNDFEHKLDDSFAAKKQALLSEGSFFKWVAVQGVDWTRSGRFQQGAFSSSYQATVRGYAVVSCTGAFGLIYCKTGP